MKKQNILLLISIIALLLNSCSDDFLDKKPLANVTSENFFEKESDLKLYTNSFYKMLPGMSIYNGDYIADNIIQSNLSNEMRGTRTVPSTGGGWKWEELRNINFFIENNKKCSDKSAQKHYNGVARFFRAYFYFQKLKKFGDVPWYDFVIDLKDSKSLKKARDSREFIATKILEDLDYAIANLRSSKKVYRVTKWTALALKSRVGLYEGTYQKYRKNLGYEKFLEASYKASKELIEESGYTVYSSGNIEKDYLNLFTSHNAINSEIILSRKYSEKLSVSHRVNYYTTTPSYGRPSMPKDLVNSYLMADGTRFTDHPNYNKKLFRDETKNRDLRLSQTIRTPGYSRIGENMTKAPDLAASMTGYQLIKFVTSSQYDTFDKSINDLPVFRFGEVLLNYAEAKTELNTISQSDINISINKLRDRVGMPHLKVNWANANPDNYLAKQYTAIEGENKGLLLEIRRERRIELYMENFRWDDIVRWKEGQKLTQPIRGMFFNGLGEYDLDGNGSIDVIIYKDQKPSSKDNVLYLKVGKDVFFDSKNLIDPHPNFNKRNFDEDKDYLYPIPTIELQLNPNLKQNPKW